MTCGNQIASQTNNNHRLPLSLSLFSNLPIKPQFLYFPVGSLLENRVIHTYLPSRPLNPGGGRSLQGQLAAMPPTFRSSRSGRQFGDGANRTRTGQVDHDVFEGLPVRRWTRQTQTVSQVPKTEASETIVAGPGGKQTIPEHPMPRDSHLLTPASRALLRASRAGCIYIRQTATKDEDDDEKDATDVEEQPVLQSSERSFVTRKWTTVPKHLEAAEVEFLAKRRPGLPSLYGAAAAAAGADGANASQPMRRTRFKKVDPASGNISVYEAWVPEGHRIEGEITNDAQLKPQNAEMPVTVTPEAPAPGTVIEGVGVVNGEGVVVAEAGSAAVMTPPKRRPPPPKRKAKGFGKGRRKKVMFAPGEGGDASLVHGAGTGTDGTQEKDGDASSRVSADHPGQEDDDDDGEDGEESDEGDESMMEAKTPETPMHQPSAEPVSESAAEQTPASTTAADAVIDTKLSETPSRPPSQVPEASATPSASEEPSRPAADGAVAALDAQTEQKVILEDVEMTDSKPDAPLGDIATTIPPPAPATVEAVKEPTPTSAQETPQPEPSTLPTESKDQPMGDFVQDTEEPAATEPSTAPVTAISHDDNDAMDVSADQPQASPEKASGAEQPPPQADAPSDEKLEEPKQEESNDVDMLDSLEASLNKPVESEPEKQPEQPDQAALAKPVTDSATEQPTPALPEPVEPSAETTPVKAEKTPEKPTPLTETLGENPISEPQSTEQPTEPAAPTESVPPSAEETPTPAEPVKEATPLEEKSAEVPEQPSMQQNTPLEPVSAPEGVSEPQQAEKQETPAEPSPPQPALDQPETQEPPAQTQPDIPSKEESAPPTDETPVSQPVPETQEPTPSKPAEEPSIAESDAPSTAAVSVSVDSIPEPSASAEVPEAESVPKVETSLGSGSEAEPTPQLDFGSTNDEFNEKPLEGRESGDAGAPSVAAESTEEKPQPPSEPTTDA